MKWILAILALALAGCPSPLTPPATVAETPPVVTPSATVAVTGITISLASQTMPPGTQYTLSATVAPADATDKAVTWTSSAPTVASVASGVVQALADGSATIIVTTHDGGFSATCAVTVQAQVIPPPVGLQGPVLAALYDGATVRLWDGTNTVDWKTGVAKHGNGRKISVGSVLYFLDAAGNITSAINLPALPAGVTVIGDPVIYTFEAIDPQWALDHGARFTPYTRIWEDGVEDVDWPWYSNQWTYAQSFECADGDIMVVDATGHFWDLMHPELTNVSNGYQNIAWAWEAGPIFYFPDPALNAVTVYDASYPGGHAAVWSGGNLGGWGPSHLWTLWNGAYYDGYGNKWDGTTLTVRSTGMKMWNAVPTLAWCQANGYAWPQTVDTPNMLAAYADADALYFVECNTGLLISWTPQTDVVVKAGQLYQGDGSQATGGAKIGALQPEMVDGALYFHDAGTLWRRDNASTLISSLSADQQMWVMR